jgi:broad specificity phosphatase PhoE
MQVTEVLLLRHGQSEGNELGRFGGHGATPLTALGRAQATSVARALALEARIDAVYASDLPRAIDTAAPTATAFGVEIQTRPGLRERDVGDMTGLTFDEARDRFPVEYAAMMRRDATVRPPGGELHSERLALALPVLEEAVSAQAGGRVLLVSHAMTLQLVLFHILGVDARSVLPRLALRTDNAALHRLRFHDGLWTVLALNDQRHLVV